MFAQTAFAAVDAVERLSRHDPTLKTLLLTQVKESELDKVADCLLAHPNVATHVHLCGSGNKMADGTGIKLARYLAASTTVDSLNLLKNRLSEATYLALAAALRVNTSLRSLYLGPCAPADKRRIDAAFAEALWLNPDRPAYSDWMLYSKRRRDLPRLMTAAKQLGHPPLRMLLALLC